MAINIGTVILQLRKDKQLTQEQLSEIFGVSTTAVCKWETGVTHPDIELLPVIAEFFGVSVDGLLGYDMRKAEAGIREQIGIGVELLNNNQKTKEALAYFSKLAYRYPNHFEVLRFYAIAKGLAAGQNDNEQVKDTMQKDQDELMRQCQVLAAKMSRKEQDIIISDILTAYIGRKDFAKAEQTLAEIEPSGCYPLDYDSGAFWLEVYKGDMEEAERKYFKLLDVLHKDVMVFARHNIYQNKPAQLIKQNNKMIQVYELFKEELTKKHYFPLAFLHESNAIAYLKLGEKEKAFNELKKFAESIAHMPDMVESCKNVVKRFTLSSSFYFINIQVEEEAYEFIKNTYENL